MLALMLFALLAYVVPSPFPLLESTTRYEWRLHVDWQGVPLTSAHGVKPRPGRTLVRTLPLTDGGWLEADSGFVERLLPGGRASAWRLATDIERVDGLEVSDDRIALIAGGIQVETWLRVYALADGRELFRRHLADTLIPKPRIVGDRIAVLDSDGVGVEVYDATGVRVLDLDRPKGQWDERDGVVVIADGERLTRVDLATGAIVERRFARKAIEAVRLAGDDVIVASGSGQRLLLERVNIASGAVAWKAKVPLVATRSAFVVGADAIYLASEADVVRVIDRASGGVRWTYGLPDAWLARLPDGRVVSAREGAPALVLAPATPPVARPVTFTMRIVDKCRTPEWPVGLYVGDELLKPDAKGRIRGTVAIAGEVPVTVHDYSGGFAQRLVGEHDRYDFGTVHVDTCVPYD